MGEKRRIYVPPITGEFAPEDQILARAREYFLIVIQAFTPKPLYVLRDEVLPKYRAAFARHKERGKSDDEVKALSCQAFVNVIIGDEAEGVRSLREFQDARDASLGLFDASSALIAWSKAFNLEGKRARVDTVWPLLAGLETILHWHFDPAGWLWERPNPPGWRPPVQLFKESPAPPETLPPIQLKMVVPWQPTTDEEKSAVTALDERMRQRVMKAYGHSDAALRNDLIKEIMDDLKSEMERYPQTVEIDVPDWSTGVEREREFRSRMQDSFDHWLNLHINERKEVARSLGVMEVPGARGPEPFVWAAKYQVEKMSASQIVKECAKSNYNISESAIEDAIQRVLDTIRLERRSGKRGSKPKKGLVKR